MEICQPCGKVGDHISACARDDCPVPKSYCGCQFYGADLDGDPHRASCPVVTGEPGDDIPGGSGG